MSTKIVLSFIISLLVWSSESDLYQEAVQGFQRGRFNEVVDLLSRLPTAELDRPSTQNLKALALCELRRFDEALAASARAAKADPDNLNYVYNQGLIYIAMQDFRGAEKLFRDALRSTPNSSKLYEGLGESLFSLYEFPEAEKSFSKALEIEPSNASAEVARAKLYHAIGDKEKFGAAALRALQLGPHNYQACYYFGLWLNDYENDKVQAEKYFEKSIELYPGFAGALSALGKNLSGQGKWERAAQLYERALAVDPQNRQIYFQISAAYRKLGLAEKADWAMQRFKALEAEGISPLRKSPGP
jgi:tetratricopeptide (TPR) repeat protein